MSSKTHILNVPREDLPSWAEECTFNVDKDIYTYKDYHNRLYETHTRIPPNSTWNPWGDVPMKSKVPTNEKTTSTNEDNGVSEHGALVAKGQLIEAGAVVEGAVRITGAQLTLSTTSGTTKVVFEWVLEDGTALLQSDVTLNPGQRVDKIEFDFTGPSSDNLEAVCFVRGLSNDSNDS